VAMETNILGLIATALFVIIPTSCAPAPPHASRLPPPPPDPNPLSAVKRLDAVDACSWASGLCQAFWLW
jgi:hypothetical protein